MPWRWSRWPSTRPAGPAPTIPTWVRSLTALLLSPTGTHLADIRTTLETRPSLGGRGWRSLVTGTGLIVATVMPGFLAASLAPRIRGDFSFGDSELGIAIAFFYVVSATGSVPAGYLVDPIGGGRRKWVAPRFFNPPSPGGA